MASLLNDDGWITTQTENLQSRLIYNDRLPHYFANDLQDLLECLHTEIGDNKEKLKTAINYLLALDK